jgi:hypothetical protein
MKRRLRGALAHTVIVAVAGAVVAWSALSLPGCSSSPDQEKQTASTRAETAQTAVAGEAGGGASAPPARRDDGQGSLAGVDHDGTDDALESEGAYRNAEGRDAADADDESSDLGKERDKLERLLDDNERRSTALEAEQLAEQELLGAESREQEESRAEAAAAEAAAAEAAAAEATEAARAAASTANEPPAGEKPGDAPADRKADRYAEGQAETESGGEAAPPAPPEADEQEVQRPASGPSAAPEESAATPAPDSEPEARSVAEQPPWEQPAQPAPTGATRELAETPDAGDAGSDDAPESLRRRREAYIPDPTIAHPLGPLLEGVDWLAEVSPLPPGNLPEAPVLVCRLDGERVSPFGAGEIDSLARGFGRDGAVLDAGIDGTTGAVGLSDLLADARDRGTGALALVRVEGDGHARSARVLVYATTTGALVAHREGLIPSLEVIGAVLADLTR